MREQQHNNAPCLGAATTCNAKSPPTSACYAGQRDLLDHAVLPNTLCRTACESRATGQNC